mmetsp:Transcript_23100/g.48921  ORF Transcript_23100/g.48921 Transcript_23100/m.48921 type:complete len:329 (-) Transcript_23100:741-1727(-)
MPFGIPSCDCSVCSIDVTSSAVSTGVRAISIGILSIFYVFFAAAALCLCDIRGLIFARLSTDFVIVFLFPRENQDFSGQHRVQPPIVGHENHVTHVHTQKDERLPPKNLRLREYSHQQTENHQAHGVVGAVPKERPPRERQYLLRANGTHADDEQYVEDGAAHDGSDADVALLEGADEAGEELGRRPPRRHERRARHVHGEVEVVLAGHLLEGGDEELVADDGQGEEEVEHAEEVEDGQPGGVGFFERWALDVLLVQEGGWVRFRVGESAASGFIVVLQRPATAVVIIWQVRVLKDDIFQQPSPSYRCPFAVAIAVAAAVICDFKLWP